MGAAQTDAANTSTRLLLPADRLAVHSPALHSRRSQSRCDNSACLATAHRLGLSFHATLRTNSGLQSHPQPCQHRPNPGPDSIDLLLMYSMPKKAHPGLRATHRHGQLGSPSLEWYRSALQVIQSQSVEFVTLQ